MPRDRRRRAGERQPGRGALACLAFLVAGGCKETTPSTTAADSGSTDLTSSYGVDCTLYVRSDTIGAPTNPSETTEHFVARSDGSTKRRVTLSGFTVDADLSPASDDASLADLSLVIRETETAYRFRIPRLGMPSMFAGNHGLSHLVYAGPESYQRNLGIQFWCVGAPPTGAAPKGTNPTPDPSGRAPFDVACTVELRSSPGGDVQRAEVMTLTRDEIKTLDWNPFGITVHVTESPRPFEGRSMTFDLWKKPNGTGSYNSRQLVQLSPAYPITNDLADGTLTGRGSVGFGPDGELSYRCAAR